MEAINNNIITLKKPDIYLILNRCAKSISKELGLGFPDSETNQFAKMIYDVNSSLFRSFLSTKAGPSDKRKMEEQRPKEQRPKANENKPVMNE